jgi:hypothetical protein
LSLPDPPNSPSIPSPFPAQRVAILVKGEAPCAVNSDSVDFLARNERPTGADQNRPSGSSNLAVALPPYAVIVDEIALDGRDHHYRWQMVLPPDLIGQAKQVGRDVIVTDPETGDYLLIRLLNDDPEVDVTIGSSRLLEPLGSLEAIGFETERQRAKFEVLLKAFRKGDPIPPDNTALVGLGEALEEANLFFAEENARIQKAFDDQLVARQQEWAGLPEGADDLGESRQLDFQLHGNARKAFERVGDAYHFDGNNASHLRIPVASVPPKGTDFTISFWFKRQTIRTVGNLFRQTGEGCRGNRGIALGYAYNQYLVIGANRNNRAWKDTEGLGRDWDFLAFTYDKDQRLALYVNGELKFEVRTHYMDFHTFDSVIGNGFQGWIDDFRISDRIIQPATMLHHYRANRLRDWERLRNHRAQMEK